jgi:hypothetical protein
MVLACVCKWKSCSASSAVFKENNHILYGYYNIHHGPSNSSLSKNMERHLCIDDDRVDRKETYRVAHHHCWPEHLMMKNKSERRSVKQLIYSTEAINYGTVFFELCNRLDVIINKGPLDLIINKGIKKDENDGKSM